MSNLYTIQVKALTSIEGETFTEALSLHFVFKRTKKPLVVSCHLSCYEDLFNEEVTRFLMGVYSRLGSAGVDRALISEMLLSIETVVTSEVFLRQCTLVDFRPRYERSDLVDCAFVAIRPLAVQ